MIANLAWTQSTETDLHHYNLYYGTQSGVYDMREEHTNIQAAVQQLADGRTWYFAVTAVDNTGNESGYSTEVTKINRFISIRQ